MKKTRKLLSIILTILMLSFVFVGCDNAVDDNGNNGTDVETPGDTTDDQTDTNQPTDTENKKIGMILSTLNNPFFVTMKDGAEQKANELGYDLIVLDSKDDAPTERANVEDLVQQEVAVIIINPTDSDAVGNAIMVANESNIPVITVDRSANTGEVVAHIASDNAAGGKLAGEYILEQIGNAGKLVELQGIPGASATRDRGAGFHEAVDGVEGVEVVASQSAEFDRQKGLNVMENIIQATPDFNAVFAHNDEMALGALQAVKSANMDVVIVGFDGTDDAVQAVQDGDMAATVAQQPDVMGSLAVENAMKHLGGEQLEEYIPVDLKLITKE
ncbi:ribose ABC transporter substrate-binding protein RbsB [Vallitalea okinawensis]|uniref:ribose ABC transporter substrate-binding protein RbsB n=1 Tax=Vallitalea okinawensis TaxID=2078660 RepID=UPI001FA8F236|nr:ribose ABC transporter substrate-binding protein RbsB [Vallitalea okinawensis]